MKKKHKLQRESDCLCLLQWVSRHRDDKQTYESLAESTGVPATTIHRLIVEAVEDPCGSSLTRAAYKFHFEWEIMDSNGKILDAEFRGYGN